MLILPWTPKFALTYLGLGFRSGTPTTKCQHWRPQKHRGFNTTLFPVRLEFSELTFQQPHCHKNKVFVFSSFQDVDQHGWTLALKNDHFCRLIFHGQNSETVSEDCQEFNVVPVQKFDHDVDSVGFSDSVLGSVAHTGWIFLQIIVLEMIFGDLKIFIIFKG